MIASVRMEGRSYSCCGGVFINSYRSMKLLLKFNVNPFDVCPDNNIQVGGDHAANMLKSEHDKIVRGDNVNSQHTTTDA
jgi:hypothetical protein